MSAQITVHESEAVHDLRVGSMSRFWKRSRNGSTNGLLGIPEAPKPPNLAKRGGCWFERGPLKIHLGVEADFRPARKAHPAFIVEDLAILSATLSKAGHPLKTDEPLEGYTRVFV